MRSPAELAHKLARQRENANLREARLLDNPDAWPVTLSIGKPRPAAIRDQIAEVREHLRAWHGVGVGEVVWKEANYRSTTETVRYPAQWIIPDTETWMRACADKAVVSQHRLLAQLLASSDPDFRSLLARISHHEIPERREAARHT